MKGVISAAHTEPERAIRTVFQSAYWQRCRVQPIRNVFALVPKGSQETRAVITPAIFAQPDLLASAAFLR